MNRSPGTSVYPLRSAKGDSMTPALWIGATVLVVLLAVWRLRRASRKLRRILAEEAERPADTEEQSRPAMAG